MTTNIQLEHLAKKNNIDLDYIIYKDEIFKIPYRSNLDIIINMSSTKHPGTHWICIHTFKDIIVYFDSFGEEPPEEIVIWSKNNQKKIIYNNYVIQHITDIDCGQLCLMFLGLIQGKITTSIY